MHKIRREREIDCLVNAGAVPPGWRRGALELINVIAEAQQIACPFHIVH